MTIAKRGGLLVTYPTYQYTAIVSKLGMTITKREGVCELVSKVSNVLM